MMQLTWRGVVMAGLMLCAFLGSGARAVWGQEDWDALARQWNAAYGAGRYQEAERIARRMIDDTQYWKPYLGLALHHQGKHKEAEPLLDSYLRFARKEHGEHLVTVEAIMNLGGLYSDQGRFEEARKLLEEGVQMSLRVFGPDHQATLSCQTNLAIALHELGDLDRAVKLYREIIDRQHKSQIEDPMVRINPVVNLGTLYKELGRYDQAEAITRYGITLARHLGVAMDNPTVIYLARNLAQIYVDQDRFPEARSLLEWAIASLERATDRDEELLGHLYGTVAVCHSNLGDHPKALEMVQRAIDIKKRFGGEDYFELGEIYGLAGWLSLQAGDAARAEAWLRMHLKSVEKHRGESHFSLVWARITLVHALARQDKFAEAEPLLRQAAAAFDSPGVNTQVRCIVRFWQAKFAWQNGDKQSAVALLRQSLDLAELTREFAGGAEVERAMDFSQYSDAFELMLQWQAELGDVEDALATIERARARTFLEALTMSRVDLMAEHTAEERAAIQKRDAELRGRISALEGQLTRLDQQETRSDNEFKARQDKQRGILEATAQARDALYQHQRDVQAASPVYRRLIATQAKPPKLADVQRRLVGEKGLLISYFFGDERSYVLIVRPASAQLVPLSIDAETAQVLGLVRGPLTRKALQKVLVGEGKGDLLKGGLLQHIAKDEPLGDDFSRLHTLWKVLLPEDVRDDVLSGTASHLAIIPDGPLALLPMEALVVRMEPSSVYLLDFAPPINYLPSASVALSLLDRPAAAPTREPVFTVGDPAYDQNAAPEQTPGDPLLQLASRTRGGSFRRGLNRLQYADDESNGVAAAFRGAGLQAAQLLGQAATERNMRDRVAGRHIIHLACHGMSDDSYGNFFGALAFVPGAKTNNPNDDGMLTLAEIYGLDLRGCELSILSACQTNHGPEQKGEGVWALSRGFLVAGSRRVIASNWLVSDMAGQEVITEMCQTIAQSEKNTVEKKGVEKNGAERNSGTADYASALLEAKRSCRKKHPHPAYWAPLILLGPN